MEASALPYPSPQPGYMISSTSNPICRATPVIGVNTTAFPCSPGSPGQVSPVTRGNAAELASFQTSQATAASLSSQSANTHPTSNNDSNRFKRLDCTAPTANSSIPLALSTVLTPGPGLQVVSLSGLFSNLGYLLPKLRHAAALLVTLLFIWSALGNFCAYRFGNSCNCLRDIRFSHNQHLWSSRNCNNSAIFGAGVLPGVLFAPGGQHLHAKATPTTSAHPSPTSPLALHLHFQPGGPWSSPAGVPHLRFLHHTQAVEPGAPICCPV